MLTKEDLQAIAGLLVPIETRIGNLESRFAVEAVSGKPLRQVGKPLR